MPVAPVKTELTDRWRAGSRIAVSEESSETSRNGTWLRPLVAVTRWLHVYLSMLGFFALVFFAVTGVTLNHPDWFFAGKETIDETGGTIDPALLNPEPAGKPAGVEDPVDDAIPVDQAGPIDRLAVVETLRSRHALQGAVAEFSADEYQCIVVFKGPGYSADAFIDRATGKYDLREIRQGAVAVINDLHKGRDSGAAWSWVIDVSAVVMTISALTGLALLVCFRRRRATGLLAAAIGTVAVILVYVFYVP
ncbi:MAG: PepSY-associated TM helix domain-containing protein [Planctomycetota bacterium]